MSSSKAKSISWDSPFKKKANDLSWRRPPAGRWWADSRGRDCSRSALHPPYSPPPPLLLGPLSQWSSLCPPSQSLRLLQRPLLMWPPPALGSFPSPPHLLESFKQCCGSGSGIRGLFDPWISDPGSQTHYFWEPSDNFFGKKFYNSLKTGPNFVFNISKQSYDNNFFTPFFRCCFWIRDPRSGMGKNQDPGSGINIPDPQHWV